MKTIILGMNASPNRRVFDPYDKGGSGHRLLSFVNEHLTDLNKPHKTPEEFIDAFDWKNCIEADHWDLKIARENAGYLLESLHDRSVIVMGSGPMNALRLMPHPSAKYGRWSKHDISWSAFYFMILPHPSGLTRNYNDKGMRTIAADALLTHGNWK